MHTLDDAFAKRTMLPLTMGALRFFYEHYGPSPGKHRKRTFGASPLLYQNRSFCQDRLRTKIGKVENKAGVFLQPEHSTTMSRGPVRSTPPPFSLLLSVSFL